MQVRPMLVTIKTPAVKHCGSILYFAAPAMAPSTAPLKAPLTYPTDAPSKMALVEPSSVQYSSM